jgi:hypothetical protein
MGGDTCIRCGRAPVVLPAAARSPRPERRQIAWTRPGVVRAIRAFAFFRGRMPTRSDWQGRMPDDWPPVKTVELLFGSVGAAVSAADVEPRPPQRRARTRAA